MWGEPCVLTVSFEQGDEQVPRPPQPRASRAAFCEQELGREPSHRAGAQSKSFTGHLLQTLSSYFCPTSTVASFLLESGIFYYAASGRGHLSGRDTIVNSWARRELHRHKPISSIPCLLLTDPAMEAIASGHLPILWELWAGLISRLPTSSNHCSLQNVGKLRNEVWSDFFSGEMPSLPFSPTHRREIMSCV